MIDFKKIIKKQARKIIFEKAAPKVLPMEGEAKPMLGWKAKLAGALALVGTLATMLSQYLGG